MLIPIFNPPLDDLEVTYLSNPEGVGVVTHTVKNTNVFTANDKVMIGKEGREKTEIVQVTSVTDQQTLVTGATLFSHEADDPITKLRYDQIKIYRSTTGLSGTYSLLTTVAVDVDNADLISTYDDVTSVSTYYYKVSFYNSVSAIESAQSDPIPATGNARGTVGALIDEFLAEISDPTETTITRDEIYNILNDCSDDLLQQVSRPYEFLKTRTTLNRTAGVNYINFPTDSSGKQIMWMFDRMDYNFTDSTTSPTTDITYTIPVIEVEHFRQKFQDNTIDSTTEDDTTAWMAIDTSVNRFRFNPPFKTAGSAVFYLHYWKYFSTIDTAGDTFETPTQRPYRLYLFAQYYRQLARTDQTKIYLMNQYTQDYNKAKVDLVRSNRKDKGSPRSFSFKPQTYNGWRGQ